MKHLFFVTLLVFICPAMTVQAQKYVTRQGKVSFSSDAPLEKIEAHNSTATSVLDTETGAMEFAVLIKAFQFEKALMQEHFNENYMESSKFPKATFKGTIENWKKEMLQKGSSVPVTVKGEITIHGVTKPLTTTGTLNLSDKTLQATSTFTLAVADFNIKIPSMVRDNIAKEVKVLVDIKYEPYTK